MIVRYTLTHVCLKKVYSRYYRSCNICNIKGILQKGPYLPCVSMADRALSTGYHRYVRFSGLIQPISLLMTSYHHHHVGNVLKVQVMEQCYAIYVFVLANRVWMYKHGDLWMLYTHAGEALGCVCWIGLMSKRWSNVFIAGWYVIFA